MNQKSRDLLIDRVLGARTKREMEAAEEAARRWLDENPGDVRVIAAQERLDGARAKLEDKERKINRISLIAFLATSLVVGSLTLAFSGSWVLAALASAVIGVWVASEVWQTLYGNNLVAGDEDV